MSDPRNVAHDKKVAQEKEHDQTKSAGAGARKSRKAKKDESPDAQIAESTEAPKQEPAAPGEHEKSMAVLSKLKEMEFHSKANIATLAELTLTIEDELKQKDFAEPIGELYSAQDSFESKIAALIERYEAHCDGLKQPA